MAKKTPTEDRVKNSVVAYIVMHGFTNNLEVKSGDQQGVDIYAEHRGSAARRIYIEAKGSTGNKNNKTLAIEIAWGQLVSRVKTLNPNRIHGLAFPKDWASNVKKLSSLAVGKALNLRYYFVDNEGVVTEYTATQLASAEFSEGGNRVGRKKGRKKKARRRRK